MQSNQDGMNPYAYVGGNPETDTDPTGTYVAGLGGESYIPGSSTYTSHGETYNVSNGQPSNTGGYINGWLPGVGANAPVQKHPPLLPSDDLHLQAACLDNPECRSAWHDYENRQNQAAFNATFPVVAGIADIAFSLAADGYEDPEIGIDDIEQASEDEEMAEYGLQCSFVSQTPVKTDHGEKAIGKIRPGEKVWSYNPKTKKMELQPVLHVWIHTDHDLVDLTITGKDKTGKAKSKVIHTNEEHPFLTVEQGFTPVAKLKVGMHIRRSNGGVGIITAWKAISGSHQMYNLEVQQDHTFTVGNEQWVVHNECDPTEDDINKTLSSDNDGTRFEGETGSLIS